MGSFVSVLNQHILNVIPNLQYKDIRSATFYCGDRNQMPDLHLIWRITLSIKLGNKPSLTKCENSIK